MIKPWNSWFFMKNKKKNPLPSYFTTLILLSCLSCTQAPFPVLSPEEALASFQLQDGLEIQLVAAEPMVQDPVAMAFDEDERLWVVEMLGFMQDIDGTDERAPIGRVIVLSDKNADGKMDDSTVFLDSLILPRAIAVVKAGILIAEDKPLWYAQDTNGDGKADKKTLVDSTYAKPGLIEHSANGLWRGLDNWYYNGKADYRYRLVGDQWIRDTTEFRGQWGICHDDAGRLFYNYNWSQLHADLVPPNYLFRNPHHEATSGIDHGVTLDRKVFPIRPTPAINRGYVPGTLDENGRILEFASACSPFVLRSDLMGQSFLGNAFVCEPTANLVKRNIVEESGYLLQAHYAYANKEFLASTDERFRPVFLASGPEGGLYVTDMYRGIVQHGPYMTPYLRQITLERRLDKYIHLGRIWRIVPKGWKKGSIKKLSTFSLDSLVNLLGDSNGWTRDMAQRLLIEKADKSIIPRLETLVLNHSDYRARLHALWTLEGLNSPQTDLFFKAMQDESPYVQAAVMHILDKLAPQDPTLPAQLAKVLSQKKNPPSHLVRLQTALTAGSLPTEYAFPLLASLLTDSVESSVMRDAVMSGLYNREYSFLQHLWDIPEWKATQAGKEIFLEMLAKSIVNKGNVGELTNLLAILGKKPQQLDWREKALLTGMAFATADSTVIDLPAAPKIFIDSTGIDAGIKTQLNKIATRFKWPGKETIAAVSGNKIEVEKTDPKIIANGRRQYLTVCSGCHGADGTGMKRFAPPLKGSEWVTGDEKQLIYILLHGMQGPVEVAGKRYDAPEILPVMPSFTTLDNGDLAAILTYLRQEWGHSAPPVKASSVGGVRITTQGKVTPWTMEELRSVVGREQ